ncbi:MAG: hypothetical protein OXH70_19205, partial [Acidobacteria bacterium]|nr:hypothetical protein [Acidobacteriota bacterium]
MGELAIRHEIASAVKLLSRLLVMLLEGLQRVGNPTGFINNGDPRPSCGGCILSRPRFAITAWHSHRIEHGPAERGTGDCRPGGPGTASDYPHRGPGSGNRGAAELGDGGLGAPGDHGPGGPGSGEGGADGCPTGGDGGDGGASGSEPPMPAREPDSITPLEG